VKKNKVLPVSAAALLISALLHAGIIGAASGMFSLFKGKHTAVNQPVDVTLELMPYVAKTGQKTELAKNDMDARSETSENDDVGGGTAAAAGDDEIKSSIYAYNDAVKQKIQANRFYPPQARQKGIAGKSVVAFSINRNGTVADARLLTSSGDEMLDKEAVQNVRRAAPYPPLPDAIKAEPFALQIAIVFKLN
jgi:TonB family protein